MTHTPNPMQVQDAALRIVYVAEAVAGEYATTTAEEVAQIEAVRDAVLCLIDEIGTPYGSPADTVRRIVAAIFRDRISLAARYGGVR